MVCTIGERKCKIHEGGIGGCGRYLVDAGKIRERYPDRYLSALDTAMESMPLVHYHPTGRFLQVCLVGCDSACHGCGTVSRPGRGMTSSANGR